MVMAAAAVIGMGSAHAGGLQLPSRGVRPTARGGAFVAGADGLSAFGFNPAGLAVLAGGESRRHLIIDASFVGHSASYQRIDSGMNSRERVDNQAPGLPIPTVGAAFDIGPRAVLAFGVYAPYAGLGKYPEAGPQRYTLIDLSESLLAITEIAVGYRVSDRLRVGVGVQNMGFFMSSTVAFSSCPGEVPCAPEDPEFDAIGKVTQLSPFNPSGVIGAQLELTDTVRVGASFQLPFFISGKGTFATRLPPSGFFDGARVVGDRADVSFTWPAALRVGVELEPMPRWRAELAGSVELWSMHEEFSIEPIGVRIENAPGVGTYEVGPLSIPRHFENSFSIHLGVEGQPSASLPLTILAGYAFESAAAPDSYLSVMTVDGNKHLVAAGIGMDMSSWTVNATFGFVAVTSRTVTPDQGIAPQLNPIRDEDSHVFVNWGDYSASWLIIGAGLSRAL